jgi:hypothetical protein
MDNSQSKNETYQKTKPQTINENMEDCECYRQADVLDQTRLRAPTFPSQNNYLRDLGRKNAAQSSTIRES